MDSDLGIVKRTEMDRTVELELPADEFDINLDYEAAIGALVSPAERTPKVRSRTGRENARALTLMYT